MKTKLLLVAVVLAVLILDVSAQKKKLRKNRKHRTSSEAPALLKSAEIPDIDIKERIADDKYHEKERLRVQDLANQLPNIDSDGGIAIDPCKEIQCGAGRICEINEEGEGECICIRECPFEVDDRRKVCSSANETWNSDCEVHQQRCLCLTGQDGCKKQEYSHVQINYYGQCRDMPVCSEEEMSDFPRRMRDWLFNIMRDLADRRELSEHYLDMEREAETNLTRRWINAAIWKWCDLDANDNDRSVSRHELFPIRAPLMSLEHCISPFLDGCDMDDDHSITLREWGKCLQLDENDLEDRCDDFAASN